jgi:hypothetical protein
MLAWSGAYLNTGTTLTLMSPHFPYPFGCFQSVYASQRNRLIFAPPCYLFPLTAPGFRLTDRTVSLVVEPLKLQRYVRYVQYHVAKRQETLRGAYILLHGLFMWVILFSEWIPITVYSRIQSAPFLQFQRAKKSDAD